MFEDEGWSDFVKSVKKISTKKLDEVSYLPTKNLQPDSKKTKNEFKKIEVNNLFKNSFSDSKTPEKPSNKALNSHYLSAIKTGKLNPELKIDLHGMNINQAHKYFIDKVKLAQRKNLSFLLIVTGKSTYENALNKGDFSIKTIKSEINDWINNSEICELV
ncbi:MAG: Smr/MutS family protein [Rickettsiales bacterium]|nr:Smr/MutS family protein [Rickettsiales bacterium]